MTPTAMVDGSLRIQRFEDWVLRDAVGAPTTGERPHGAWTIVGGFRGMGAGLDGLFEMLGAGTADSRDVVTGTAEVSLPERSSS